MQGWLESHCSREFVCMKETEAASASLGGIYSDVALRDVVHSWKQKQNFTVVPRHLKMKRLC